MNYSIFISIIFLISSFPITLSQQPYIRQTECHVIQNTSSVLGYTCNGATPTCQSYLTFRSQPPFTSVSAISTLFSVNSSQFAQLNSVPQDAVFGTNRMVLIPITCSCSGNYYQVNTSYVVQQDDTYLIIANNTFQGLSTCQALQFQNDNQTELFPGSRLRVPLRCACPTRAQIDNGVNYLLSYLVTWNQFVSSISALFGVDTGAALAANGLSEQDFNIYPFTTLLIPLQDPPSSSQVTAPQPPPPPSSATPSPAAPSGGGGGSNRTWIYVLIGVVGGIVLISSIGGFIFCFFVRKKKQKSEPAASAQSFESIDKTLGKEVDEESQDFLESISTIALSLKVYTFEELKIATHDFNPSCLIKGSVYRGTINGDLAAIKRMNAGDVSKEINLLNKINHFNLIRLSGVCFNQGNWYLIYEYAPNGPLSDWIHDKSGHKIMDWNKRLQIALDIASGLNYLHSYTSPPHVHKDLNSSNVLLDKDFRAKIANFGLARSAEGQEGQFALTRHIVGTKGYMAPEYLENGLISPKLDVYAFGVLMLEIFTGKEVSLLTPVMNENGQGNVRDVMDPMLKGNYPAELAIVVFRLIDSCLKKELSERANMDDIFQSLSKISTSSLSGEWAISLSEHQTEPR